MRAGIATAVLVAALALAVGAVACTPAATATGAGAAHRAMSDRGVAPDGNDPRDAVTSGRLALVKVVMVTRHGIRAGTKSPAFLARYSRRKWPTWPVGPGQLTPHGARAMGQLGRWLRMHYADAGLLGASGCPAAGVATVWADNADQRTRDSGQAMMNGLFPDCGMRAYWRPLGHDDPLFHGSAAAPLDYAAAARAVRAHGDPDAPGPGYRPAMRELEKVLGLAKACTNRAPACAWTRQPNRLVRKPDGGIAMDGPLHVAATLSEILLLEYAQGLPADAGVVSPAQLRAVMPLHTMYARLMRGTPYLAAYNARALVAAILRGLDPAQPGDAHGPAAATRLLLFLGHDTNLSNLGALLRVHWTLPDQPDPTAPDTTFAFELLRDARGDAYVRVRIYYQTLQQLRGATVLDAANPAHFVTLAPPGCTAGPAHNLCTLRHLTGLLRHQARLTEPAGRGTDARRATPRPGR